jgi:hypothetical protein
MTEDIRRLARDDRVTAEPGREDGSGHQARRLLQQRVSRRALLTLSLARGAAIAVGQAPRPAAANKAAPAPEQPRPAPCGACGGDHSLAAVCPVEAHQRALARGFGRRPEFATNEREGGS